MKLAQYFSIGLTSKKRMRPGRADRTRSPVRFVELDSIPRAHLKQFRGAASSAPSDPSVNRQTDPMKRDCSPIRAPAFPAFHLSPPNVHWLSAIGY
jgi:hypothetical protein